LSIHLPGRSASAARIRESPPYGEQEGAAYNGHFECTCYHPLFVFNQLGDVERCALRPGNVHSADGWRAVLEPVVARYRGIVKRLYFRGDAAFVQHRIVQRQPDKPHERQPIRQLIFGLVVRQRVTASATPAP